MNKNDLELYQQAIKDKDNLCQKAEEFQYGDFVTPFTANMVLKLPMERQIGRVVQIRKEVGAFGSDNFFLRHANGNLIVWENECFFKIKKKYAERLETLYNRCDAIEIDDDKPDIGYRGVGEKVFTVGFIIPSPYPADYVTPMKAVQVGIKEKIREIINS